MIDYIKRLKEVIKEDASVQDIVSRFEEMCNEPIDNDMILFESGTFSFTGEKLFYFSLVRQFPNEEEEYYQIHVDVLFDANDENKALQETVWNEDIEENIFEYVRKSESFNYAISDDYKKVDIYMDET